MAPQMGDPKIRFKMYKAGKIWLYSAVVFIAATMGMGIDNRQVMADVAEGNVQTEQVTEATPNQSDADKPATTSSATVNATTAASSSTDVSQSTSQATRQPVRATTGEQATNQTTANKSVPSADQTVTKSATVANVDSQGQAQEVSANRVANPKPVVVNSTATQTSDQQTTPQQTTPQQTTPQQSTVAKQPAAKSGETKQVVSEVNQAKPDQQRVGDVVTPTEVKKAPDPVDTTSKPTVEPEKRSDVPQTNTYPGTIFHQVPVYVGGQLANPPGKDAIINGTGVSNKIGQLQAADLIQPQHEKEIMSGGYYDGQTAWQAGFRTDNQLMYLYEVDKTGKIVQTQEIPTPDSSQFDANWKYTKNGTDLFWEYGSLQIVTKTGAQNIRPLQYIQNIPVKYVDPMGNEIAPQAKVSGYVGTYIDAPYPQIPGYRLIRVPFQNNDHQFLINNVTATTPTTEFKLEQVNTYVDKYFKVLDSQNTQLVYVVVKYPPAYGGGTETSRTVEMKADPYGFFGFGFNRAWVTASMPMPVGNPLIFTYESIASYKLQINYLNKETGVAMAVPYQADGAGTYEIISPVFYGFTSSLNDVQGVLQRDTIVNVTYERTPDPVKPIEPGQPVTPEKPIIPVTPIVPVDPVTPSRPIEPLRPDEPMTPLVSVTPNEPAGPGQPVVPGESTRVVPVPVPDAQKGTKPDQPTALNLPNDSAKLTAPTIEALSHPNDVGVKVSNPQMPSQNERANVSPKIDQTVNRLNDKSGASQVNEPKPQTIRSEKQAGMLPQTDEKNNVGISIAGGVLLGLVAGLVGWIYRKKRI